MLKSLSALVRSKPDLPNSSEESKPLPRVDSIDLESLFSKDILGDQRNKENKVLSTIMDDDQEHTNSLRTIPNGEFETILLGEHQSRGVKSMP